MKVSNNPILAACACFIPTKKGLSLGACVTLVSPFTNLGHRQQVAFDFFSIPLHPSIWIYNGFLSRFRNNWLDSRRKSLVVTCIRWDVRHYIRLRPAQVSGSWGSRKGEVMSCATFAGGNKQNRMCESHECIKSLIYSVCVFGI